MNAAARSLFVDAIFFKLLQALDDACIVNLCGLLAAFYAIVFRSSDEFWKSGVRLYRFVY
jgi:hypothetical protein